MRGATVRLERDPLKAFVRHGDVESRRLGDDGPHRRSDRVECLQVADAGCLRRGFRRRGSGFGSDRVFRFDVRARRTVIAQDRQGRILFIVTPQGYFSLHQLSAYLTASELDLDIAINLDGGGSTGLLVAEPREVIPSKVLLPFVILVYPR